eukprot:TRINITY_DN6441_c0_g1_i1.p2 TRINITY_DN6441_c0_g1~~TRINITY_DN6441_c0_g1_i1.p2  ORF type:complete len:278 (-),score=65.09 TRINITY_DN6441_c0_g1_i1:34-762(-)
MASVDVGGGDVDVYVGGYFNYAGTSDDQDDAQNLAVLRGGDGGVWEGMDVLYPISSLASYNGAVFISYATCTDTVGESLPDRSYYNPEEDNLSQFAIAPANQGPSDACVNSLIMEQELLFIGGNFVVNLPGTTTTVYGAIAYNVTSFEWRSLNVPASIQAPQGVGSYDINTFSLMELDGNNYVMLGGYFSFSANGNTYNSLALYNLGTETWEPMSTFTAGATVDQTISPTAATPSSPALTSL